MKDVFAKRTLGQSVNLTLQITDKAKALKAKDTIYLSIGVPDAPLDSRMEKDAIRALKAGATTYTTSAGMDGLRETIAFGRPWFKRKENVIVTAGASEAVFSLMGSLIDPGDEVIIPAPSYFIYRKSVECFGGKPVFVPLEMRNGSWVLDVAKVEKVITAKTKLIVLNSPHNPTGWVADNATMQSLVGIVEKHDLLLLSDEIYKDYLYKGDFIPAERLSKKVITIDGISKTYSATGLRIGWIIAEEEIIERMLPLHQLIVFSAPTPFQVATARLLATNRQKTISRMRKVYQKRRDAVISLLGESARIDIARSEGAFYLFPSIKGIESVNFANKLLDKEHVVVVPGLDYGKEWDSYIRISYTQSEKELVKACRRITNFLESVDESRNWKAV